MITKFDVQNAYYRLVVDKKYTFIILLSMSFGLAVSLFLFTQVYARGYSSLPFQDGNRFVYATRYENDFARTNGGLYDYEINTAKKSQNVLDDFAAFEARSFTLSTVEFTEHIDGVATSSNFFKLSGVEPLIGRVFLPSDDNLSSPAVVVVSYDVWEKRFQKQTDILGKVINLDGKPTAIVGVMPKDFKFPINANIWLSNVPQETVGSNVSGWSTIVGKLKTGVTLDQADGQFKQISKEIEHNYPQQYSGKSIIVQSYTKAFARPFSLLIDIMTVVAISVLMMSLFSVVSLIVVRSLENAKEAAIKSALGINAVKIIISPLLESFLLCLFAGLGGVFICNLGLNFASGYLTDSSSPFWWQLKFDMHIILAAFIFVFLAWVCTGLLPLYLAVRRPSMALLAGGRKGGRGSKAGPLMNSIISLQVSCAFILMVFTGICINTFYKIAQADYGISTAGFMIATVQPAESLYPDMVKRVEYYNKLEQHISSLANVEAVAFTGSLPGSYSYLSSYNGVDVDLSKNGAFLQTIEIPISTNFFDVLKTSLLEGRAFIDADNEGTEPVVIISEKIAKKISPIGSAIGKKIHLNPDKDGPLLTVIGIAPNLLFGPPISLEEMDLDVLYRPMKQVMPSWFGMTVVVKVKGNTYDIGKDLINAARETDSQVALSGMMSYEDSLLTNGNDFKVLIYNFLPATLLAFCMAALGVYAISARIVLQRTNDIGVMKALGVEDRHINKIFLLDALKKLIGGLIIGMILFVLFIPGIISKLVVVDNSFLILVCIIVACVLSAVVFIASFIPLMRAHKLTPFDAMNN